MAPPVIRKYLCNAPRPENWEEVSESVLRYLPRAQASLRTSLTELQKHHTFKTGPGRKSNAEHAMCFLEYLLDQLNNKDYAPPPQSPAIVHSTLCQVCDQTGDLLQCRTCYRSFHLECVRPCPERIDEFQCAYCVLLAETKQTKARKQAAAAVRFMARKRNQIKREKGIPVNDEQKQEEEDGGESLIVTAERPNAAAASPVGDGSSRGKRHRKAPLIYNPQQGPASHWQSDEKYTASPGTDGTQDDRRRALEEDEPPVSSPEETNESRSMDESHCIFCFDNPRIQVCCFCACRRCFGKHSKSQTLICDQCEDEYHLTCLDPPLRTVPRDKWYCPSCVATKMGRQRSLPKRLVEERQTRSTEPRKRGRPSASPISSTSRKRGRPRSLSSHSADNNEKTVVSRSGRTVKRTTFPDEVEEGEQHLRTMGNQRRGPRVSYSPASGTDLPVVIPTVHLPLVETVVPISTTPTTSGTTASVTTGFAAMPSTAGATLPGTTGSAEPSVRSSGSVGTNDGSLSKLGPRRKPGARECMQISRRFRNEVIPDHYMETLMDYCNRGKVEHLIRMRERLDEHARYLEMQLAGLEVQVRRVGECSVHVPAAAEVARRSPVGGEDAVSL